MIRAKGLTIAFDHEAVSGLTFSVGDGEHVSIIGSNGSGKSTLAYAIARVIPEVIPARITGVLQAAPAGLITQNPSTQLLAMTVRQELHGQIPQRYQHLLDRPIFTLSEGEKQIVNLLANLAQDRPLLLLDEPTELLDPIEAAHLRRLIPKQKTVVWLDNEDMGFGERKIRIGKAAKKISRETYSIQGRRFAVQAKASKPFPFSMALDLRPGEKACIIGRNGSGKTTRLKAACGLLPGTKPRADLGYASQNPAHFLFQDTVRQEMGDAWQKKSGGFGIGHLLGREPMSLSKGEQKLVSVAAVSHHPVLVLDEPTTWLDPLNRRQVAAFVKDAEQTMLIATHDPSIVDACDIVLFADKERLTPVPKARARRFLNVRI
ncbi:MAG: ATP-binding cassette domain-containing protein [Nanoarchaeota archaeon]